MEAKPEFVNNHIHTTYSFSPYTPAEAVNRAKAAGLLTAGLMDHDSIGGGPEFRAAGALAGIGVTCGLECRASLAGTPFETRKLNSPDQIGNMTSWASSRRTSCREFISPPRTSC